MYLITKWIDFENLGIRDNIKRLDPLTTLNSEVAIIIIVKDIDNSNAGFSDGTGQFGDLVFIDEIDISQLHAASCSPCTGLVAHRSLCGRLYPFVARNHTGWRKILSVVGLIGEAILQWANPISCLIRWFHELRGSTANSLELGLGGQYIVPGIASGFL